MVYVYSGKYQVEAINYNNHTIRLVYPSVQKGTCPSLPRYYLAYHNFTYGDPYELRQWKKAGTVAIPLTVVVIFMSCEKPVKSHLYIDTASCSNGGSTSGALSQSEKHTYVIVNGSLK